MAQKTIVNNRVLAKVEVEIIKILKPFSNDFFCRPTIMEVDKMPTETKVNSRKNPIRATTIPAPTEIMISPNPVKPIKKSPESKSPPSSKSFAVGMTVVFEIVSAGAATICKVVSCVCAGEVK